ncbi:histidine kinase [Chryseotalea sanaruensis]|uniref:Histidine kinase n=1 Tax=Chryseotalea sanaruensis TaxID=2482724 RepID=A0A401UBZ4_9BACT|nr:sensor histidine kinase [Chryseotalea sanaruensis]GCC52426.1 histidine kinase [Chryseotalea sanaruensis]
MTHIFVHSIIFRICSAPLFGVLIYLLILLINNTLSAAEEIFNNQELYVCILLSYISFESMRGVIRLLEYKSTPGVSFQKRLFIQLILSLGLSVSLVGFVIAAYFHFIIGFSIAVRELYVFLLIFGTTGLLYNLLYFSHYYLLRENRQRLEEEQKIREKVEADFSSFKNEINPDLLYESLENLILTLHYNAEEAEEQIDYLASIYRYGLVNRQKELVSLEEELQIANNLIALLNVPHQGSIGLYTEIKNLNEIYLIPGSLLVTIDTVVRNTLLSKRSPLQFHLYSEDDDYIVLQHNMNDRLLQHQESLQAFSRLQRSYTFYSEKSFVQVKAGLENYIKFPLVYIAKEKEITETT